jgi:hypothetical protein
LTGNIVVTNAALSFSQIVKPAQYLVLSVSEDMTLSENAAQIQCCKV